MPGRWVQPQLRLQEAAARGDQPSATSGRPRQHQDARLQAGDHDVSLLALLAANVGRKTLLTARGLGIALAARNYQGRLTHSCPPQTVSPARLCSICALLAGLTAVGLM